MNKKQNWDEIQIQISVCVVFRSIIKYEVMPYECSNFGTKLTRDHFFSCFNDVVFVLVKQNTTSCHLKTGHCYLVI